MMLCFFRLSDGAPSTPACTISGGPAPDPAFSGPYEPAGGSGIGKRKRAYFWKDGRVFRGGVQETTDRGQDKSRQCAARSGLCFSSIFCPFSQCVPSARNVRSDIRSLLTLRFSHLARAGHGA